MNYNNYGEKFSSEMSYEEFTSFRFSLVPDAFLCTTSEKIPSDTDFPYPDFTVLFRDDIKKMIKTKSYDYISNPIDEDKLRKYGQGKYVINSIAKHCDTDILKYFFRDTTDKEILDLLFRFSKIDTIKKFSKEISSFLSNLVKAGYSCNCDIKFISFLYYNGLEITKHHGVMAIKYCELDIVKWIFSNINEIDYKFIRKDLKEHRIHSKYPDVVMWAVDNGFFAHPNLSVFAICNNLKIASIDPNPELTNELVHYYASINEFDKIKNYDYTELIGTTEFAHVLYYSVIYNNTDIFETSLSFFLTFKEIKLIIDAGGLDALIYICKIPQHNNNPPYITVNYNDMAVKFMDKYSDEIAKLCPSLEGMPIIKRFFRELNYALKFHKQGKIDIYYDIRNEKNQHDNMSWENVDYVFSGNDTKLINDVSRVGKGILERPKYRLSQNAYSNIYSAFDKEKTLYRLLSNSLLYGCFDIIEDLLNIGIRFKKYDINAAFACGEPMVNWLLSSGYYNFPITKEFIDDCILLSPRLKTEIVKWTLKNNI